MKPLSDYLNHSQYSCETWLQSWCFRRRIRSVYLLSNKPWCLCVVTGRVHQTWQAMTYSWVGMKGRGHNPNEVCNVLLFPAALLIACFNFQSLFQLNPCEFTNCLFSKNVSDYSNMFTIYFRLFLQWKSELRALCCVFLMFTFVLWDFLRCWCLKPITKLCFFKKEKPFFFFRKRG